jgi:Rps23 Pro-64 3,4-dihydroxylase Tpa1-like proline 4-hydroxylase
MTAEAKPISSNLVSGYPFPHLVLSNFFSEKFWSKIENELKMLEKSAPDRNFNSDFGVKSEWKNFSDLYPSLQSMLNFLFSNRFIDQLKETFGILSEVAITPDWTFDGGGYVISPPGSFLGYHADFNFSSEAKRYRVMNVLIYANRDYRGSFGGELHLLDSDSKTVEKLVAPEANTFLAFLTDDKAFHGVSRNQKDFFRRSFNLYYYADAPISTNQDLIPHKTIWLDTESHVH